MLTFHNYSNVEAVVIQLTKLLGVSINPQDITEEFEKHPDNPSMLAISDVLNWFGISNGAYRVNADELRDVRTPFIAHTKKNNDFVIVKDIGVDQITLSDHKRTNFRMPLAEFEKIYNGIVLSAEATEATTAFKQNWLDRFALYKIPAAILVLSLALTFILFVYTNYITNLTWQIGLITLFKTAGLITSVLLLTQSIDKNNPLIQSLCGSDDKTNCNAILTSKAATVFKGLTWSEVGFFYFAGTWLALLIGGGSVALLQILAVLNIISLPYTIYSINYQARIAKQWCVFCTVVQGLLWLEFIPLITSLKQPLNISANVVISLLVFAIAPVAIWILLKPLFLKAQQLTALKSQLQKFKYNRGLFETALKEQPKYAIPDDEWSIVLGNVEASNIITMVSNPYCQPCNKAHAQIEEALNSMDNIQVRIVFVGNNVNESDVNSRVHRHLMNLHAMADKTIIKHALHDWYRQKQKSYDAWAKTYPITTSVDVKEQLARQKEWVTIAEITTTPTILVNGFKLPKVYQLIDLKYMLE